MNILWFRLLNFAYLGGRGEIQGFPKKTPDCLYYIELKDLDRVLLVYMYYSFYMILLATGLSGLKRSSNHIV